MRLALLCSLTICACGAETRFYVDQRGDYAGGKSFGQVGPIEFITAKVVTDAGEGRVEVIKPRDPAHGNGTLLLEVNGTGKLTPPETVLSTGVTIVRLSWPDEKTLGAGVREIAGFLKFKGGPMLLGDQRRFLKRAVVVDSGAWVGEFMKSGKNVDEKGRPILDATLAGGPAKSFDIDKAQPLTK